VPWIALDHPEASGLFDQAMTELSRRFITPVFGWASTVVDVGGGTGALLAAILAANPGARGVLYDLPAVVAGARAVLDEAGVGDRCESLAGDFFESVPSGADVYLLANIVHDWDDERAWRILANCRAAMADDGRVLLCESLLPDGTDPSPARLMDLNMLVSASGGRQRTSGELAGLLAGAGLELAAVLPGGIYSLVVAAPA
jgi:spermidine synthase